MSTIFGSVNSAPLTQAEISTSASKTTASSFQRTSGGTRAGWARNTAASPGRVDDRHPLLRHRDAERPARRFLGRDDSAVSTDCCFAGYRDLSLGAAAYLNSAASNRALKQPSGCCRGNNK